MGAGPEAVPAAAPLPRVVAGALTPDVDCRAAAPVLPFDAATAVALDPSACSAPPPTVTVCGADRTPRSRCNLRSPAWTDTATSARTSRPASTDSAARLACSDPTRISGPPATCPTAGTLDLNRSSGQRTSRSFAVPGAHSCGLRGKTPQRSGDSRRPRRTPHHRSRSPSRRSDRACWPPPRSGSPAAGGPTPPVPT